MRLIKRLIELAFVVLIISLFMKNKDVEVNIAYFGLVEPVKVAFWELVTVCVSVGIIIAAVGDFITQLKWIKERRRMIKTDQEHQQVVEDLNRQMTQLKSENDKLKQDVDTKNAEADQARTELKAKSAELVSMRSELESQYPFPKDEPVSGVPPSPTLTLEEAPYSFPKDEPASETDKPDVHSPPKPK